MVRWRAVAGVLLAGLGIGAAAAGTEPAVIDTAFAPYVVGFATQFDGRTVSVITGVVAQVERDLGGYLMVALLPLNATRDGLARDPVRGVVEWRILFGAEHSGERAIDASLFFPGIIVTVAVYDAAAGTAPPPGPPRGMASRVAARASTVVRCPPRVVPAIGVDCTAYAASTRHGLGPEPAQVFPGLVAVPPPDIGAPPARFAVLDRFNVDQANIAFGTSAGSLDAILPASAWMPANSAGTCVATLTGLPDGSPVSVGTVTFVSPWIRRGEFVFVGADARQYRAVETMTFEATSRRVTTVAEIQGGPIKITINGATTLPSTPAWTPEVLQTLTGFAYSGSSGFLPLGPADFADLSSFVIENRTVIPLGTVAAPDRLPDPGALVRSFTNAAGITSYEALLMLHSMELTMRALIFQAPPCA